MNFKTTLIIFLFNGLLLCNNTRKTDEFYIELPENWIQIPRGSVEFLIKEVDHPAFKPAYENYSYLYQQKSKDTLFTLPYLLIQVNNKGRIAKSDILETDNMLVDKLTLYIWSVKDSTINVIIPTEKGSINVYGVSTLQTFKENEAVFHNIIKSMVVAHDLVYKDDFVHNTPILRDIIRKENFSTLMFFILILLVVAARGYKRKLASK